MPDAYDVFEGRYVQLLAAESGAGDLRIITTRAVPEGKVWTILGAAYSPSAAENKQVAWFVSTKVNSIYPLTIPQSFDYKADTYLSFPLVREGMEVKLWPGDSLGAARDSATAGSTMRIYVRYIETDLPPYRYVDPQTQIVRRAVGHSTNLRSSASGSVSRGGIDVGERSEGGHRSEPK